MKRDHSNVLVHKYLRTNRWVLNKVHDSLDKIGLYRGQPPLLFALWEKDHLSRKELCIILGVQPATITKMVKRLTQSGYVTSMQDADDSRVSRVCLTNKGKMIEPEVIKTFEDLNKEIFSCLDESELVQFDQLLTKIGQSIGGGQHE